jgi:hypothetical protein
VSIALGHPDFVEGCKTNQRLFSWAVIFFLHENKECDILQMFSGVHSAACPDSWTYTLDEDVAARAPDTVTRLALAAGCDRFILCFGPPPKRRKAAAVHGEAWTKQGEIVL